MYICQNHIVYPTDSDINDNPEIVNHDSYLLYIDRHLVHEVTSPQAFSGLRLSKRKVRRPDLTFATMDHNVPTTNRSLPLVDETSSIQMNTLDENCKEFGITLFDLNHPNQGIVHVIGPELGITLPGTTIVCGDSHTSTHGAFGAFAFGIGTSEVEHVLATQCLWLSKPKTMAVNFNGTLKNNFAISSKDMILYLIRNIGIGGGIRIGIGIGIGIDIAIGIGITIGIRIAIGIGIGIGIAIGTGIAIAIGITIGIA